MNIIDLYCGMGGWAKGLIDAGHQVTGYDIVDFSAVYPGNFIQCDLLTYTNFPLKIDVIVASPPCTEFSKSSFPSTWISVKKYPPNIDKGLKLFNKVYEIMKFVKHKYFIIENVRGAQKFVGKAREHKGSRYLWGNYPDFELYGTVIDIYGKGKSNNPTIRSIIPYSISRGLGEKLKGD
jgi:hypothetical protein